MHVTMNPFVATTESNVAVTEFVTGEAAANFQMMFNIGIRIRKLDSLVSVVLACYQCEN